MKKLFILPFIIFILITQGMAATIDSDLNEGNLIVTLSNEDMRDIDDKNKGRRIPPRPIYCVINVENGVNITGMDDSPIIVFEIYDCYGSCIASFNEERDFVETLFNLTGDLEVRFHTDGHLLRGFVTL